MRRPDAWSGRLPWLVLTIGASVAAAASFAMTGWMGLDPCHLCIFQRLLFMILAVLGLVATLAVGSRGTALVGLAPGGATLLVSASGISVAAYQSWLQRQPAEDVSCVAGTPGLIERWVEWLGQRMPDLFMATGFCEDKALVILGLSLANWALLAFATMLGLGAWGLLRALRVRRGGI